MATSSIQIRNTPVVKYLLRRADDALVLGHRLSEWCGHAPMMEEDVALANIALDLIGQSRLLYEYAGLAEEQGHGEDDFAYLREVNEYGNILLAEQPNGDFAQTIIRLFLYSAFIDGYWQQMAQCGDATLAAIGAKAEKESAYHLRHSGEWVVRLGDGTEESHKRAQRALDILWPYTGEMFETDTEEHALIARGLVPDPQSFQVPWRAHVSAIVTRATLTLPAAGWMQTGGRTGRHSEHLGHLLSELQYLQRSHPGVTW
jgi:ring-1,2-phenylacetyl-CoA epoxidase subunit PaaC